MQEQAETTPDKNLSDLCIQEQIILMSATNYERLPMMEVLFEQLQVPLINSLSNYTSAKAEVTLKSFEYMPCSEALSGLVSPSLFGIAKAKPWNGMLGIIAEPALIFTVLQKMLGGKPIPMPSKPRAFTGIEKRIASKLYDVILRELAQKLSEVTPVELNISALEDNIEELDIAPEESACIKVIMDISIEGQGGLVTYIIPYIAFDPVRATFAQPFRGGEIGGEDSWRGAITKSLQHTDVQLTAIMQEMTAPLHEVLSWKQGSIIDIGVDIEHEVEMICSGKKMFRAAMGSRKNGSIALKITETLQEEETAS